MVKTLPSNGGGMVQSLVRKLSSQVPCGQKTKTRNRSNIVTNSIEIFKVVHIKKKIFKQEKKKQFLYMYLVLALGV